MKANNRTVKFRFISCCQPFLLEMKLQPQIILCKLLPGKNTLDFSLNISEGPYGLYMV